MTLEGSVAEDMKWHAEQKTCCISYIYEYNVPQERHDFNNYQYDDNSNIIIL